MQDFAAHEQNMLQLSDFLYLIVLTYLTYALISQELTVR